MGKTFHFQPSPGILPPEIESQILSGIELIRKRGEGLILIGLPQDDNVIYINIEKNEADSAQKIRIVNAMIKRLLKLHDKLAEQR